MTTERPAAEAPAASKTPDEVRSALAAEWASRAPGTPEDVLRFYRDCPGDLLADDLNVFHTSPERRRWTEVVQFIARNQQSQLIVDIGCGAGHDLKALRETLGPDVWLSGVEPNDELRARLMDAGFAVAPDVEGAPIETADMLTCFDVLEHVADPEAFLSGIASRAKLGCYFIETTATTDCGTPLHLAENRGWHPGRALEATGWEKIDVEGRLRVWRRIRTEQRQRTSIIVCAYRSLSIPTTQALLKIAENLDGADTRIVIGGEAGINRARSVAASRWYRETADDVFVMVDDDIVFQPSDIERLVGLCRDGHDIICGAYPVRDGGHLALRGKHGVLTFGPNLPPVEIEYAATGFVAVHRRVIEALVPTLPLCHANQPFAFWPFFDFEAVPDEACGGWNYLSEDYYFSKIAQAQGFATWLDPTLLLGHLGTVEINVRNMIQIHAALKG